MTITHISYDMTVYFFFRIIFDFDLNFILLCDLVSMFYLIWCPVSNNYYLFHDYNPITSDIWRPIGMIIENDEYTLCMFVCMKFTSLTYILMCI